jgi:hypothetical protein
MRHWCIGLIFLGIHLFLAAMPCSGGTPTPTGSKPDFQLAHPPDIVLPPMVYTGPIMDDIGMKPITYTGPDLSDITMDPIHFSKATLAVSPPPALSRSSVKSAKAATWQAAPIPGTPPGVKILSPKPGQTVTGSVLLDVKITGWQGTPDVELSWWWSAPAPAGQWPSTPKSMTVVSSLNGKTRVTIPASAFPKDGRWRVAAVVKVSDKQRVSDDVSFNLAGVMPPPGKTIIIKKKPKQTLPSGTVKKPVAGKRIQLRPVGPLQPR